MKLFTHVMVIVCLSLSLLTLSACAGNKMNTDPKQSLGESRTTPEPSQVRTQAGPAAPTKWEYKLDVVTYDAECAAKAIEPYKSEKLVTDLQKNYGVSSLGNRFGLALLWQRGSIGESMPKGAMDQILAVYTQCGASTFDTYAKKMGDDAWEMVSYKQLEYTLSPSSSLGLAATTVDYGYEIMWKRPKTTK